MLELPKFALSIRQPWAYAIVSGRKNIENRDWSTKFRGKICIHAAKTLIKRDYYDDRQFIIDTQDPVKWGNEFIDLEELHDYRIRINGEVKAHFQHIRSEGLAECLRKAVLAVSIQDSFLKNELSERINQNEQ